jgi:cytoskeleton protein RodZ
MNLQAPPSMDSDIGPGEVGDLLRASRLRHGQELADVARALRIRIVYLQAIEDARYEDLPGTVYAIGFIRSYAEHLGLDGEHLVERFKADASGQRATRKPLMTFPAMVPENGIPRGAVITMGALILIGAYGAWYFLSTKDMYVADLIPPVPDAITRALEAGRTGIAAVTDRARNDPSAAAARQTEQKVAEQKAAEPKAVVEPAPVVPAPAPAAPSIAAPPPAVPSAAISPPPAAAPSSAQPVPSAAQPVQAPVAAADAASHDEDDDEVERTPPPSLATTPAQTSQIAAAVPTAKPAVPAQAAPAASDAAPVALDDRGGVDAPATGSQLASLPGASADPDRQIVLKANVDSWIQIRDTTENKLVLTRLLRKGEEYTVPAREGLTLVTGNAGGLDVTVGGDSTPSLGPIGVVRRNILLDPERLRAGTAIVE